MLNNFSAEEGLLPFQDNAELLKKALLQFPRRYQHDFSKPVKVDLRRVLFFAASYQGKHMKHLFQDADESILPKNWAHVLVPERYRHLEGPDFYFQRNHIEDPGHPNRSCGRKFRKGEPIYRCVTCSKDESSGLCLDCFVEEDHKAHDVIPLICQRENGGVCDCGDEDAWKLEVKCPHHGVPEVPESDIPDQLKESLLKTFEIVLDFIIDVMAGSCPILNYSKPINAESVLLNTHQSSFEQGKYCGTDWPAEKFCLLLYNDQNRQYRDAVQKITSTTKKIPDFALMVADEVNLTGRAKLMCHSDLEELINSRNDLEAVGLPSCIRNARDYFREEMCSEIILWLNEMVNGPIYRNYNIARDLLSKAFCKKWDIGVKPRLSNHDFGNGHLVYTEIPNIAENGSKMEKDHILQPPVHWQQSHAKWNVDQKTADECQYDTNFFAKYNESFHGSRLQYLLYFDIRFWKSPRSNLHSLITSVLTSNREYRSIVCCQYVDIYPKLLEMFFHHDREPEYSCMTSLTTQVFTSASNSTLITEHGDLSRLLAAAYGYLTTLNLMHPDNIELSNSLLIQAFKNRRIGQVFFDVCCVLSKTTSFDNIINEDFINQVCDIMKLFQGKPTLKREALEHVEYESTDYGLYFNMYSVISSLAEMVAKVFSKSDKQDVLPLIGLSLQRVVESGIFEEKEDDEDPTDVSELKTRVIDTIEGPFLVDEFKPHTSPVSFLHPMHAFVTWTVQYTNLDNLDDMRHFWDVLNNDTLFTLLEYPLRTLVLLSQIRVGMWVRNGYSIRTQQNIYRSSGIRESGFKRDIYMTQLLMCILPSNQILASFINKWSLLSWLNEDFTNHEDYDPVTLPLMVEEFILLMIQLLCETSYQFDTDTNFIQNRIKRELIHSLCFETMPYSKLCSSIPDYMSHEKRFDLILNSVSDYSPPSGLNSTGLYKLKDEYLEQVDPYYIHYSSNKREEAEKLVKERIAKTQGIPLNETFIKPKLKSLDGTIFQNLFAVTSSKIFVQFLRSTLKYVNAEGDSSSESLLSLTLHLIHVGVEGLELSHSATFSESLWSELTADHNEPFYYESVGSLLYKFLNDESYSSHHSKIRAIFLSLQSKNILVEEYLKEQVENFDPSIIGFAGANYSGLKESEFEKKKRMAKERRAKLMAKFKKQQSVFVEKHTTCEEECDADMVLVDDGDGWMYPEEHCILCQMSLNSDDYFGVVCNLSHSSISRNVPFSDHYWTLKAFDDIYGMDSPEKLDDEGKLKEYYQKVKEGAVIGPAFPSKEHGALKTMMIANSCGHGMHYSCYQQYLASAKSRQTQITRTVPEDFENTEFICPLCKSLGNMFIPVLWSQNRNKLSSCVRPDESWYDGFENISKLCCSEPGVISEFTHDVVTIAQKSVKPRFKLLFSAQGVPDALSDILCGLSNKIESISQPHFKDHLNRLVSDTVKGTEISLRGLSTPTGLVTDLVSNQTLTTLRVLVELKKTHLAAMAFSEQASGKRQGFSVKIAEESVGKLEYLASDRLFDAFEDIDFFDFIVSCTPFGGISQNSLYRMGLMCSMMQKLSCILAQVKDQHFDTEPVGLRDITLVQGSESSVSSLMNMVRMLRDNYPLFDNISDEIFETEEFQYVLYTMLIRSLTPLLRNFAIYSISGCADYGDVEFNFDINDGLECDRLCRFLNLPTIDEMLSLFSGTDTVEKNRFDSFVKYVSTTDTELKFSSLDYPAIVRLIDLPKRMDDIFTKLIYKKSPNLSLMMFDPAICLFCGDTVNLQRKSAITSNGECNFHVDKECLNHVGIFLLPRYSSLLLLKKGNGSFHPAPYLDPHGEYDSEMRQTQIMTLNEAKYDHFIRHMWIQQDTMNFITRKLEGTLDIGGWESL
jgi:E3 ubiquitin-protein ligase UBR1